MNFDLTNKEDRRRFVRRANSLLKNQRTNISLVDESNRTTNQNRYLHILCRILAVETGTTESYAKQVYFKELANEDIFVQTTKDPLSNKLIKIIRSSRDITLNEMRRAISNFIRWAAEQGYALPEANINDAGELKFKSEDDKKAFHQAIINTSKLESYL